VLKRLEWGEKRLYVNKAKTDISNIHAALREQYERADKHLRNKFLTMFKDNTEETRQEAQHHWELFVAEYEGMSAQIQALGDALKRLC